jgi:hypothetical protein
MEDLTIPRKRHKYIEGEEEEAKQKPDENLMGEFLKKKKVPLH